MKHLKLFENFGDIDSICKAYDIRNYIINSDGSVDVPVDGYVYLERKGLTTFPLRFGKVFGSFNCSYNHLTSLKGSPKEVGSGFYCANNQLTSLEGSPNSVGSNFYCNNNQLTSLEGSPKEVGGNFICYNNKLTSLEGGPREVGGDFYCANNQLTSLEGGPNSVGGNLYCEGNPIWNIYQLFNNYKEYMSSQDYNYLRGNSIIKSRFQEALQEIGKELPDKIIGYNYI